MKKFLLALTLLLAPAAASAQCNGVFPSNTVCGNSTGSSNTPRAVSPSTFQGSAGGTSGQLQYNNAGTLAGMPAMSGSCTINTTTGIISCPSTVSTTTYATRVAAAAATVPSIVQSIYVLGFATANDGGAGNYNKLASPPGTPRAWNFQSADGAWWQLAWPVVLPKQLGADCGGTVDDTTPTQAWSDYSSTFGVPAGGQLCTLNVPTATITTASNTNIQGGRVLTIKRSTDVVAPLLACSGSDRVTISGLTVANAAGFTSTTSNTIATGNHTFTVPAGLTLSTSAPNNNIQIAATSSPTNYMIAQITAYSGTTLTVNVVSGNAIGSGTFTAWTLASYPVNGDLAAVPSGISAFTCTNTVIRGNTVTGLFYDAIDDRNGQFDIIADNSIIGHMNRGIHAAGYLSFGAGPYSITGNNITGGAVSQYGINTSGTDGASLGLMTIAGNSVNQTIFQGINVAGQTSLSNVTGNNVVMASSGASVGIGILVEGVPSSITQHVVVNGNTINGGLNGILVNDAFYTTITSNNITAAAANCINIVGTASANQTSYINIVGNNAFSCPTAGINLTGNVATGITAVSITGNVTAVNGTGILVDANVANFALAGNVSISSTTNNYNINGVTTTPAATNN